MWFLAVAPLLTVSIQAMRIDPAASIANANTMNPYKVQSMQSDAHDGWMGMGRAPVPSVFPWPPWPPVSFTIPGPPPSRAEPQPQLLVEPQPGSQVEPQPGSQVEPCTARHPECLLRRIQSGRVLVSPHFSIDEQPPLPPLSSSTTGTTTISIGSTIGLRTDTIGITGTTTGIRTNSLANTMMVAPCRAKKTPTPWSRSTQPPPPSTAAATTLTASAIGQVPPPFLDPLPRHAHHHHHHHHPPLHRESSRDPRDRLAARTLVSLWRPSNAAAKEDDKGDDKEDDKEESSLEEDESGTTTSAHSFEFPVLLAATASNEFPPLSMDMFKAIATVMDDQYDNNDHNVQHAPRSIPPPPSPLPPQPMRRSARGRKSTVVPKPHWIMGPHDGAGTTAGTALGLVVPTRKHWRKMGGRRSRGVTTKHGEDFMMMMTTMSMAELGSSSGRPGTDQPAEAPPP